MKRIKWYPQKDTGDASDLKQMACERLDIRKPPHRQSTSAAVVWRNRWLCETNYEHRCIFLDARTEVIQRHDSQARSRTLRYVSIS